MTISRGWAISIGCVLAFAVILGGYELLQSHDAQLKAQTTADALKPALEAAQKTIDQSKSDQAKTASDLKAQLAIISQQRTIIVTPQQAAAAMPLIVPNLPQPVQVQTVAATPTTPATQQLVIPQADIPAFQAYKLNCDESSARLMACSKDAVNFEAEVAAGNDQFKAMTKERDTWKAAAKGGTFWHRLKHDAVQIGISAAVGYAAGRIQHQ